MKCDYSVFADLTSHLPPPFYLILDLRTQTSLYNLPVFPFAAILFQHLYSSLLLPKLFMLRGVLSI